MARTKQVFKTTDYPGMPDEATKQALNKLFEHMFPGQPNAEIPGEHGGFATVARNPRLALLLINLSDYIVRDMPWTSQRRDVREVAIQILNLHYKSDYSFQAHIAPAQANGISLAQQALLPFWRTANVFNQEQRLVCEYTLAVVAGDVSEELFARVVKQYGELGAIEFTVGVAWWSFWAMIINATHTDFDFGFGNSNAQ
jgi:alkylhydroperoxidase family enzyme